MSSITEYLEELKEAFVPTVAFAEEEEESNEGEEQKSEEGEEGEEEEEEDEDEDEDEDDEDEEEETVDQMDALREECKNREDAKPLVHHYMECVERVQKAQEDPEYENSEHKEDCVEEFFHLQHHIDSCVAPTLFDRLK